MTTKMSADERLAALEAELASRKAAEAQQAVQNALLALPSPPKPGKGAGLAAEGIERQDQAREHRRRWADHQAAKLDEWTKRNREKLDAHETKLRELRDAIVAEDRRHGEETARLGDEYRKLTLAAPSPPEPQPCPPFRGPPLESGAEYAVNPAVLKQARQRAGMAA